MLRIVSSKPSLTKKVLRVDFECSYDTKMISM